MAVYYINLLLILIPGIIIKATKPAKWKNITYLCLTFGYMWCLATFRSGIGFDYVNYITIFERAKIETLREMMNTGLEPGFILLNKLMGLFVESPTVMYGIYALLILVPVAVFIYKYCADIWFSLWLYVTLTFYYTTLNFIRQSLACSIAILGYKFLKEKKFVPFAIIILLAACFHKTALIMIPIYFLCHIKLDKKWGIIYGVVTLLSYLTSSFIVDIVTNYMFTGYKGTIWLTEGFPLHFIIIPAVVFGACLALSPIWKNRDPDYSILLNLMMFSAITWLFITRHFILERFSMYMYIYVIVAIPAAISSLKAPADDFAKLDKMKAELAGKKNPGKQETAAVNTLALKISDSRKYYWCAVAAMVLLSMIYNEYGSHVNGFHGIFPYVSIF